MDLCGRGLVTVFPTVIVIFKFDRRPFPLFIVKKPTKTKSVVDFV